MKKIFSLLILCTSLGIYAQKPCEIDADVNDTIGTYKSTKQYMIFERSFADNATHIFFSLTNTNNVVGLEAQILQSSPDFIKANCFDASSRIYLQLNNGKIVTLLYLGSDTCGNLLRNDKDQYTRIITGGFVFSRENFEELKKSPVTFMRVKYSGETIDYPFKSGFVSELDKKMYEPENYFMYYLKCVDTN